MGFQQGLKGLKTAKQGIGLILLFPHHAQTADGRRGKGKAHLGRHKGRVFSCLLCKLHSGLIIPSSSIRSGLSSLMWTINNSSHHLIYLSLTCVHHMEMDWVSYYLVEPSKEFCFHCPEVLFPNLHRKHHGSIFQEGHKQ